jgi:hypothetical protein
VSDRASGFLAVMADRQSGIDDLDYFPTPPWAARAGGELIAALDPVGARTCWEPAAGGGHMVHGLRDYFEQVTASDIADHGGDPMWRVDFLDERFDQTDAPVVDWIVTNPPFVTAAAFVRAAWPRARVGVAMLCRLAFLEGAGRAKLLWQDCPLAVCAPFSERVPMVKGRWDPGASSATAYAWFIWLKRGPPEGGARLMPILPGARARLSRPSDLEKFAPAAVTPLEAEWLTP